MQAETGAAIREGNDEAQADALPLLTKVAAEKNNPQWSLVWVDGDTAFASLDQQHLLLDYTPTASWNSVGQKLVPADHSYDPTGTTVGV